MRTVSTLPVLLGMLAVAACSQPAPRITIDPSTTTSFAGPTPSNTALAPCVVLRISGNVDGQPFNSTMDPLPEIATTYGELFDPTLGAGEGMMDDTSPTITGTAAILDLCPTNTTPGTAVVTATVADDYGVTATATATIVFGPPGTSADAGMPVENLSFSCTCKNIDAFVDQTIDLVTPCFVVAFDGMGNELPNANVSFLAEAGSLADAMETTDGGQEIYLYYPHQGKYTQPQDVAPFTNEPNWVDNSTGAITRNPRDGLATLVAYTEGDNSNAVGILSGDPFVDANDNNQYDMGEQFLPSAGPGQPYSSTQTKYVWNQYKILWSGALSSNPQVATVMNSNSNYNLTIGQSDTITFQVVDQNFNALAANDPASDNISWQLTPSGSLSLGAGQPMQVAMYDTWGIDIDPNNNYEIDNPMSATTYLEQVHYDVTVVNTRTPDDGDGMEDWTVQGLVNRTGIIDDQGDPASQQSTEMVPEADVPGGVLEDM